MFDNYYMPLLLTQLCPLLLQLFRRKHINKLLIKLAEPRHFLLMFLNQVRTVSGHIYVCVCLRGIDSRFNYMFGLPMVSTL